MSDAINDALESVRRMGKDIRAAAATLTDREARYLVDAYYMMQEDRIRAAAQERALAKDGEPHVAVAWLAEQSDILENQIKGALDRYSKAHVVGEWMRGVKGIGPVISAGILAHIDIHKAPTVGHIWSFAGLEPSAVWEKGKKRPWNATLKTLCWKIGESFVKVSGDDEAFYGRLYRERKAWETERNLRGEYAERAAEALNKKRFGDDTEARVWYEGRLTEAAAREILAADAGARVGMVKKLAGEPGSGVAMLPPGHIHARAKRRTVKLFLAHLHEVWRAKLNLPCPAPYAISILGHAHRIEAPR